MSNEIHVVMGNGANHPSAVRVRYKRKPISELADSQTIQQALAAGCPHIRQHAAND